MHPQFRLTCIKRESLECRQPSLVQPIKSRDTAEGDWQEARLSRPAPKSARTERLVPIQLSCPCLVPCPHACRREQPAPFCHALLLRHPQLWLVGYFLRASPQRSANPAGRPRQSSSVFSDSAVPLANKPSEWRHLDAQMNLWRSSGGMRPLAWPVCLSPALTSSASRPSTRSTTPTQTTTSSPQLALQVQGSCYWVPTISPACVLCLQVVAVRRSIRELSCPRLTASLIACPDGAGPRASGTRRASRRRASGPTAQLCPLVYSMSSQNNMSARMTKVRL